METEEFRSPRLREELEQLLGNYVYSASADSITLTATTVAIVGDLTVSGSITYGATEVPVATEYLGTLTVGLNGTGYDVKFYGDTSGKYWLWDQDADGVVLVGTFTQTGNMAVTGTFTLTGAPTITGNAQLTGTLTVGVDNTGHDVKFFGATTLKYWLWDESEDEMVIAGSMDITGNSQFTGTITVGVNDTGHDVKFYGASTGKYWEWDESADGVVLVGTMTITGATAITGAVDITGAVGITGAVTMATTQKIQWRDTGLYVASSVNGTLDVVADTILTLTAPTLTVTCSTVCTLAGITNVSDTTDASAVGTAAMKTAGGLGVAKKAYIGTDLVMVGGDIDLSTAGTGTYDIIVKDNVADALSIRDDAADIMVITTTTGSDLVSFTPNVYFAAALTSTGRMYPKSTVTSKTSAAAVTYTAAEMLNSMIIDAISEACTATTHTGTQIIAAIPNAVDGSSFWFILENGAASAISITLTAGADVTITGTATVGQNNTKLFFGIVTSVASHTVTIYSVGTMVT